MWRLEWGWVILMSKLKTWYKKNLKYRKQDVREKKKQIKTDTLYLIKLAILKKPEGSCMPEGSP